MARKEGEEKDIQKGQEPQHSNRHMFIMLIYCLVPILLIFALIKFGISSNVLFLLLILLCPELVFKARKIFDKQGFDYLKIIISSGFDVEKIKKFNKLGVPFDVVGVGSSLFRKKIDFTADIVKVNGKILSKVGRKYKPNPRLKEVN